MLTIGINCAGRWTNAGLARDGSLLCEVNEELGRRQCEELPLIAAKLMEQAGAPFCSLELVAVGTGPGYYTGIRAGVAYGAALAEGLGLKVVPISSLELFIWELRHKYKYIAPVFKAKKSSFYAALYEGGERPSAVIKPKFVNAENFARELRGYSGAAVISPDIAAYPQLAESGAELVSKNSASGGCCAQMGEIFASLAIQPREIRGEYLRAPDIGPTSE